MSKLPPSARDIEIYESVHIQHCSTWHIADRHNISQTRVRQIIRRVVEWLGEVLPPQVKLAKEQEIRLAREIAADRFQHQLEEVTHLWQDTRESKYAGIRIRLTTAQARLGVVGGVAAGLMADAAEGIPVPIWERDAREGEAPAEPHPKSKIENPKSSANPAHSPTEDLPDQETSAKPKPRKHTKQELATLRKEYPWLFWVLGLKEITPEMIAIAEEVGLPFEPRVIQALYDQGYLPRPDADSCSPPPGDCSASSATAANEPTAAGPPENETESGALTCDDIAVGQDALQAAPNTPAQPLLTATKALPVTELRISPDQPGATQTAAALIAIDAEKNSAAALALENYNPT